MQVQPQQPLRIVRVLLDPYDTDTYFVKATVYKSETSDILATIRLTDLGNRRFVGEFETPADPSGEGYFLDITTTVYTDSEYTVVSTNYAEENKNYIVKSILGRTDMPLGGSDIDYKRLRKIIREEIDLTEKEELPIKELMDNLKKIDNFISATDKLVSNENDKINFKLILSQLTANLQNIETQIQNINIPEQEKTDLAPVLNSLLTQGEQFKKAITDLTEFVEQKFTQKADRITASVDKLQEKVGLDEKARNFLANYLKVEAPQPEKPKKFRPFLNV